MSDTPDRGRAWFKRWQVWLAVGIILIAIGGIQRLVGGASEQESTAIETTASTTPSTLPASTASPSAISDDTPTATSDMAERVRASLLWQLGLENDFAEYFTRADADPTRLWGYIASIENLGPSGVRVTVQVPIVDTSRDEIRDFALGIMNLAGSEHADLSTVEVQTLDGSAEWVDRSESVVLD